MRPGVWPASAGVPRSWSAWPPRTWTMSWRRTRPCRRALNACGGVTTAADALGCLDAGATTVQVYTAFVYAGPRLVRTITEGLAAALRDRRAAAASPHATP